MKLPAPLTATILPLALLCTANCDSGSTNRTTRGAPDAVASETPRPTPGPAAVIRDYYAAIAEGDYARAYDHRADDGAASGQTFDELRRGYAETATVAVDVGSPGRIEGAAGSRYVEVPVTVEVTTTDGREQCFRGSYTLRRGVVPGATPRQRRWRIYSAALERC